MEEEIKMVTLVRFRASASESLFPATPPPRQIFPAFPSLIVHNGASKIDRKTQLAGLETGQSQIQIQQPDSSLLPLHFSILFLSKPRRWSVCSSIVCACRNGQTSS
ncbi:hypothetical protein Droror1_Dr00027578 [Drosera rotundifolia]